MVPGPRVGSRSRGVPPESLDALDGLPTEAPGQVTFGKLEHEVPRMPDQPPAGLEEPLLEAREGPAPDGDGQNQPAQQIAEVVSDHPEEQPDLVGSEAVAREARPMGGFFALLDPLLDRPTVVVEADAARFVPVSVVTMKPPEGTAPRGDARPWRSHAAAGPTTPPDTRSSGSGPAVRGSVGRGVRRAGDPRRSLEVRPPGTRRGPKRQPPPRTLSAESLEAAAGRAGRRRPAPRPSRTAWRRHRRRARSGHWGS